MPEPLVTIITPSYNQGRFIRATIESVLAQDYPAIEYIIMDGGSTDETAAIASEYKKRLAFVSEPDRGQSHAINKGFRMARGEIVSWLNSDDIILPGAVGHAVRAFERNPKLGAVYGEGNLIDDEGNVKMRFPATIPFDLWFLVHVWDYILQQSTYFRRNIFDEIGFVDETLNWGMDWDLLIRIGRRYPIEYIRELMGCLREYDEAKTFSGGHQRFRELVRIMRKHGNMRYPPGYIIYGLSTYQELICRHLPSERMRSLVKSVAGSIHSRLLHHCQGIYRDRWAGRRLRYMLPAGSGPVRICGSLPEGISELRGQIISVESRGTVVARKAVAPGSFDIEFEDAASDLAAPLSFELKASRAFVPSRCGMGPDNRRLAFMLTRIERGAN